MHFHFFCIGFFIETMNYKLLKEENMCVNCCLEWDARRSDKAPLFQVNDLLRVMDYLLCDALSPV